MAWQSQPIFVSSTFADMQAERDHLRTHVFPALEERLRRVRRHLEWVDLRLGVVVASYPDAGMRELQVLKVCLGEVQRCRPFLIVLLGDRYGWVPPPERVAAAAGEVGCHENMTGRSVTDIEIQFGVLSDAQQPRSFCYFREPLPYADMAPGVAATYADTCGTDPDAVRRSEQLAALKGDIEARLPNRIRRYAAAWDSERQCVTGLEAWGQIVLEDIWSEILATTASPEAEAEISWQQAERNALDDYIEDRTRDFIGRGAVLSRLADLASSATRDQTAWGLCLTAPPGSGKSAIFGEVHRRLKQNGGVFVLAHAAAASARAASVDDMLRRWIEELGAALGTDPGLADSADPDTIDVTFHALLARMAGERRVVLLVDGFDQFEATTRGQFATWLPRLWPANARLIATAVPCEASKIFEARAGVETLTLPPLDADEARRITEAICARYHRMLEPEVLEALLAKRGETGFAWGNTLWLVLAVEELNLVDGDDFGRATRSYTGSPAEQLRALMLDIVADLPLNVLGLYTESFERAEKLFGISLAEAFLGFLAIGRAGWRESDFRVLLPRATGEEWDELQFASLRRLFRGQIRQRGAMGQWDFNHAQMRAAVRRRLTGKNITEIKLHAWAAQHLLLSLPADDPLRQSETMVHLLGSQAWLLAAEFYGGVSLSAAELEGATRVLAEAILSSRQAGEITGLDQVLNILRTVGHTWDSRAAAVAGTIACRFLYGLDLMLEKRSELSSRAILLDATRKALEHLAASDPANAKWQRSLSAALMKIGLVQVAQGQMSEALASHRQSLDIAERLAKTDLDYATWQHDLSVVQIAIGNVLASQGQLSEALTSYRQSRDIAERLAKADPDDATWQRDLAAAQANIGDIQVAQGQLSEALTSYRQSRDIAEHLATSNPADTTRQRDLFVAFIKIGDIQVAQGQLSEALTSYRQSRNIIERLARADPSNAKWHCDLAAAQGTIANVLVTQGQLSEALTSYQQSRDIAQRLAEADPSNTEWQHRLSAALNNIGLVLVAQGQLSEALTTYRRSRDIVERLAKADPSNAIWQSDLSGTLMNIGDVQVEQGQLSEALISYQQSRDIREGLAKADPSNTKWQHGVSAALGKIGNVLATQGQLSEALTTYRRSRDIVERSAKADPNNAIWQSDLSGALMHIGDALVTKGELSEALISYRQSRDIAERLAKADPSNAAWRRDLSIAQSKIGDALVDLGQLSEALTSYRQSQDIAERLAEADPDNATWQRGPSVLLERIGDIQVAQGQLSEALTSFRRSRDIFERLAKADPDNAGWQRDLSVALTKIGDVLVAQGQLSEALTSYRQSLDIREHLTKVDPGNAGSQRDLSFVQERIGDVQVAQGQLSEAITSYRQSRDVTERLATADPDNATWQRDLALAFERLASVKTRLGAHNDALAFFRRGRDIIARQKARAPNNAIVSDDLARFNTHIAKLEQTSAPQIGGDRKAEAEDVEAQHNSGMLYTKIGDAHRAEGNLGAAMDHYQAARSVFQRLTEVNPGNIESRYNLGLLYGKLGETIRAQGDIGAAIDSYQAARAVFQRLASADPHNTKWRQDLATTQDYIGALQASQGDFSAAIETLKTSLSTRDSLVAADPGNAEQRSYLADTYKNIGAIQSAQSHFDAALASYDAALSIRERIVAADPDNGKWLRDLVEMHNGIGDLHRSQGNVAAALDSYKAGLAVAERLAATEPTNTAWRVLCASLEAVAPIHAQLGAYQDALHSFQRARDVLLQLKASSPGDAQLSEHLSWADGEIAKLEHIVAVKVLDAQAANADVGNTEGFKTFDATHFKTGDTYMRQGEFARAVAAYRASHAIIDRLIAANPVNAALQALLLMCSDRLGDAYRAHGDLPAALKAYQATHAVMERLANTDPESPQWSHSLAVSYLRIGEMHQAVGDLPAALLAYGASYVAFAGCTRRDPLNVETQYKMSISQERMGDMHSALGDQAEALGEYQGSWAIRLSLVERFPGNTHYLRDLGILHNKIGDMHRARGNLPAAFASYQAAHAAFDRLARVDGRHDGWQRDLALSMGRMAIVRKMQGACEDAKGLFRQGRDMIAKLKARTPDEALMLSEDAAWFDDQISGLA